MFDKMKIRESARSRIPLLRSLSGSIMIGSRSRSKSQSKQRRPSTKENSHHQQPAPPATATSTSTSSAAPPVPALPTTHPADPPTPVASTHPSIAITDVDNPSAASATDPSHPPSLSSRHAPNLPPVAYVAMQRKVWVKRPHASATRVEVNNDDLVDNVRDAILIKYANSLGRSIDSPDITLKIVARDQLNASSSAGQERILGPDEPIGRTLDDHFPGGQTIEDALIIELAKGRTPRPSPRPGNHQLSYNGYFVAADRYRPDEGAPDYFGPMPVQSPHMVQMGNGVTQPMTVLPTGQMAPLPSPGGMYGRRQAGRPRYGRQHTSSPIILHSSQPNPGMAESRSQMNGQSNTAIPTPPAATGDKSSITPPNRVSSPTLTQQPSQSQSQSQKPKKKKTGPRNLPNGTSTNTTNNNNSQPTPASAALLDGTVPPINVLIVEDNVINLKLLEAFMKRLKVRWTSAQDGKEAVEKWRQGGFHLVLMDIQLPIMNGLEATKEIRRLEGVNGIGVFGGKVDAVDGVEGRGDATAVDLGKDSLGDKAGFKSPVIIVALTASSLQSDRHEALAAGCNDFLTKPVNFVWMERKVTEWGCMQALIDFDGWRKWKAYASAKEAAEDPVEREKREREEKRKNKEALKAMFLKGPPGSSSKKEKEKDDGGGAGGGVNGGAVSPGVGRKEGGGGGGGGGGQQGGGVTKEVAKKRQGKRGSTGSVASVGKVGGVEGGLGVVGEEADER